MRRITMWITATLAAVALMTSYQANLSGATGKGADHGPPEVTSVAPAGQPDPIAPLDPAAAPPTPAPAGDGGGDLTVHTGKPGETR